MKRRVILLLAAGLLAGYIASGQDENNWRVVTGNVTDVNEKPVKEAIVLADRENTGITTDRKGNFRIKVGPMVRMLGVYSSKSGSAEVELTGQTTVALMLDGTFRITGFVPGEPAEEEMVSTGYSTVKKSDLNNDNSYIDGADDKYASYSNIYEMIRGQVPGVQVSGTTILIRGVSSIKVSNEPLFVVDGVVTSGIGHINPSDVQSITVLKGASATQYGSRGSAGVIVITMKRSN